MAKEKERELNKRGKGGGGGGGAYSFRRAWTRGRPLLSGKGIVKETPMIAQSERAHAPKKRKMIAALREDSGERT